MKLRPDLPLDSAGREQAQELIRVKQLSVFYGRRKALQNVSLSIPAGQITALIGPSGCGKTSFLNSLNRLTDLIPSCRVEGSIELGPLLVTDPELDVISLRRRVGMIFQKPNPFPLSIRRNLEFPLREHGVRDRSELDDRMQKALTDVGLWEEIKERLDSPAQGLSGGQQQRLCLARALALVPEVLLMDEPCSALDPISSRVVEELIVSLRGTYTLVVVTHNLAQARRIADQMAVFWNQDQCGCLLEAGPARRLFESPAHPLTRFYLQENAWG